MILNGDCLDKMREMDDNSVDAIVTDPPYGLSFMGKKWDYDVPSVEVWRECLRVLKPGGHALIACGTRTQHRMALNIEDAGFEIRDVITWLYGSGFPKSLDVSKAIDKAAGAEGEIIGKNPAFRAKQLEHDTDWETAMRPEFKRGPATEAAKHWAGWGTALKPACEFWTLARKPLSEPTVAKNVLKWGTGGINVDGCRVGVAEHEPNKRRSTGENGGADSLFGVGNSTRPATLSQGRFPANLILDEEAAAMLDEQTGELGISRGGNSKAQQKEIYGKFNATLDGKDPGFGDSGGASRFFYCAKASKSERNAGCEGLPPKAAHECVDREEGSAGLNSPRAGAGRTSGSANFHPTVKPLKLMRYLCRLITPPQGTVLDPFMGSGSTGVAAKQEGFEFIGIEREEEYAAIAEKRIESNATS